MDPQSPFAKFDTQEKITSTRTIHVMYCVVCHYVWKSPAEVKQCINCTNTDTAACLVTYETELTVM